MLDMIYNSSMALAGLCRLNQQRDQTKQNMLICKKNQTTIFRRKGLQNYQNMLKPLPLGNANLRMLSLKVGLRLLSDVCYNNQEVQGFLVEKMVECTLCNDILEKHFNPTVDHLALELIAAMAYKNHKTQNTIMKNNISHFIMGKVLSRKGVDKRVQMACARVLYCLSEQDVNRDEIIRQMRDTYKDVMPILKALLEVIRVNREKLKQHLAAQQKRANMIKQYMAMQQGAIAARNPTKMKTETGS